MSSTPFIDELRRADRPVIAEVKRRASDGTDLLGGRTVDAVVDGYVAAGAPCLSVVTGRWFGGDADLLTAVVRRSGGRPVLQKDFLTRRRQVIAAAGAGASAVLLTATLLPPSGLAGLAETALDHGLTPFVEVTTTDEIAQVPFAADCVVAVNNKDIRDQERGPAQLERSRRLLAAVTAAGCRCPVSASGIDRPEAGALLLDAGYAGLLVGTALLRSGSAGAWLDELARHRNPALRR